uniref:PP2C family protein-serine/threonine phosphatase n=1 Tax=Rhodococcus sp. R1101 TaxID=1170698 RepID=UPI000378172E
RALTGSEVEPTLTVREARAGDRYLVCSDGLSDVVSDETIADTMRQGTHDECADRLIELALRSGGPDNVTVVVADVIDLDYGQSHPIVAGAASADDEDTPPPNTAAGRAAAMRPPRATPKRVINKAPEPAPKKKRSRLWWPVAAVVVIAVLVGGLFVGRQLIRNNYYVGADDGRVTVLRGIPGDVFGYSLQEAARVGCITDEGDLTLVDPNSASCRVMLVDDLWPAAREQVRAGLPSGSLDDTREQMQRLAELDLLPVCTPEEPAPAPGGPAPGPGEPTPAPGPNGTPPTETPAVQPPAPGEPAPQPGEPAPASQPGAPLPGEPAPGEPAPNTEPAPEPAPQIPGQNCRVGA